ncbi:hypothetical protein, conserved [Leishmania tarentolae]|uniref:Flagellar calcium-binding protein EF-hand domain-containing protein n=1 Tax=Leishmania tarentolae TaxID=5689 RepID=A0A640KWZ6_LEITA|nr:hypothetical protein, conserved [Leishmania tarentolae]GET93878.1 hypothetical protein, conserved [Leishmania tarentolae]
MGCTSSSLSFRDVYIDLQQRWGLDPTLYGVLEPKGVRERSNVFASCASSTARQASQELLVRGRCLFPCDSLLVEQESLLKHPLFHGEGKGTLHPYNIVLFRRLLSAVSAEHARYAATEVFSVVRDGRFVARWDYRVWLMACCEFYHVLAILQEQKALPKATKKLMNALTRSLVQSTLLQRSTEGTVLSQDTLENVWKEASAVQLTTSTLSAPAMKQLCSQMPSVLASAKKDANSTTGKASGDSLASQLIALAKEYEKRVMLVARQQSSNPLDNCGSASASSSVPLLVFAEWAAMECALSFCGQEESFASYGVVSPSLSVVLVQRENNLRQQWRVRLLHLSEVKSALAELEPFAHISETYKQLLAEAQGLEREVEEQVARWRHDHQVLTAEDAEDMCWHLLKIWESLPNRTVHQILSCKAFECAAGADNTISTTDQLCKYLRYYLALHDLYRDVLLHQLEGSEVEGLIDGLCLPRRIHFETFRTALVAAQARHDADLDHLLGAVSGFCPLTPALALNAMRQLFDSVADTDDEDGAKGVSFDALCAMILQNLARDRHVPSSLRSIEELGRSIGIDETKRQHVFTASFLHKVSTLNQDDFSACNPLLAAQALEAAAELPQYVHHSSRVAAMVIRYASLDPRCWSALSVSDDVQSAALTRWLYQLHSESPDRVSPTEDPAHMEFAVRTLFCVAAAQRGFEDTAPVTEKLVSADVCVDSVHLRATRPLMTTSVSQSHFIRAVAATCKYLECPAEVLLNNAQALLLPANKAAEVLITKVVNPTFTIESAFRTFQSVSHSTADWHAFDDEVEEQNAEDRTQRASVHHILFVMVFNYTRQHCFSYWKNHTRYDDDLDASLSATEDGTDVDCMKWDGESELLALSRAMPLRSLAGCYRVFAQLTDQEAQHSVPAESVGDRQAVFLHAFYEEYMPFFQRLHLDENHVAAVGARALQFIASQSGRCSCDKGDLGITRNDFSSFLQFALGYLLVERAYESTVRDTLEAKSAAEDGSGELFLSEQDVRCLLACFGSFTEGGVSAIPTIEEAHLWLRSHGIDSTHKGFISLQNMLLWYSSYRAEHYALESLYDWWRGSYARGIPFTMSAVHRRERKSVIREILRVKQHREDLSESYPVEVSEDEDGYLPPEITSSVLERRWGVGEITTRLFGMDEKPTGETTAAEDGGEAQASSLSSAVPLWLVSCEDGCNATLHPTDPHSHKVHRGEFRFLLQYVHHFVSAYVSLNYTLTELEASSGAVFAEGSEHNSPSTSEAHQAKMSQLLSESLLPLLPLTTMPVEMSSTLSSVVAYVWNDIQTTGSVVNGTCRRGAHSIAAFLVGRSYLIASRARKSYLEGIRTQGLRETFNAQDGILGGLGGYDAYAKLPYWERLRICLPFGPSLQHRQRRRELFMYMDHRRRGYLTVSDIARGLMDVVQLQSFRADFTPALLRAFRATKDVVGERQNVVYLTQQTEEQVLMPSEFNAFLEYLYRYLQLYFMFDVLTCGGHVHPETLHVVQKRQWCGTDDSSESKPSGECVGAATSKRSGDAGGSVVAEDGVTAAPHTRSAAVALYEASLQPYQITLEAAPMTKEVSLAQFQMALQLLRRWGAHVENPVEVFQHVNQQCREKGKLLFNVFAIWASEQDLHPEGNDYGYDDSIDAIAIMEEEFASQ